MDFNCNYQLNSPGTMHVYTRYEKILCGGSFGIEFFGKPFNFTCHTMKFHNCFNANVHFKSFTTLRLLLHFDHLLNM